MKPHLCLAIIVVAAGIIVASPSSREDCDGNYVSQAEQVKRRLFRDAAYDPTSRPHYGSSQPVFVHVHARYTSVNHIALEDGWFSLVLWQCMNWKDDRLVSTKADFQGLPHISVGLDEVWWPRVDVVTARQEDSDSFPRLVAVQATGAVWICYSVRVRSPCSVDTRNFPNDEQVCSIRLMSSAYSDSEVKLIAGRVWGSHRSSASTEWNVTGFSFAHRTEVNRSIFEVFFHLRRFGQRHRYTTTVPCIASSLVVLATFWVPPASDRRLIVTGLNVLFVALVLRRTVAAIGSSVTTPSILLYLGMATVVQAVAAVGNVAALKGLASGRRIKVPYTLQRILSGSAGTILCLSEHQQHKTFTQQPGDEHQLSTFNATPERNGQWLLSMQALDRLFFVVFAFMTLGFLM